MEPSVGPAIIDSLPLPLTPVQHVAYETWRRTGVVPYKYQLELTLALDSGRDVFCVAGTSSGKSLVFVMIAFIRPNGMIWIVSPLNVIENQIERSYKRYGLSAVSVNASTLAPQLLQVRSPRIHAGFLSRHRRTARH
jgi:hypothetical protein